MLHVKQWKNTNTVTMETNLSEKRKKDKILFNFSSTLTGMETKESDAQSISKFIRKSNLLRKFCTIWSCDRNGASFVPRKLIWLRSRMTRSSDISDNLSVISDRDIIGERWNLWLFFYRIDSGFNHVVPSEERLPFTRNLLKHFKKIPNKEGVRKLLLIEVIKLFNVSSPVFK